MQCYYFSEHYMAAEYRIVSTLGKYFEIYFFRDHPRAQQFCTWDCTLQGKYIVTITKYLLEVKVEIQDSSLNEIVKISARTLEDALKKANKIITGLMLLG